MVLFHAQKYFLDVGVSMAQKSIPSTIGTAIGFFMFFFGFGNTIAFLIPGAQINPAWSDILAKLYGVTTTVCGMLILFMLSKKPADNKPSGNYGGPRN
jgi:hypothetical protein